MAFDARKVLQCFCRILLPPNCWKHFLKVPLYTTLYLERLIQTSLLFFSLLFFYSECLCSTRWFSSCSLKLANLLAGGPSKHLSSKFGSSGELSSSIFPYFTTKKNRNYVVKSSNVDEKNCRDKVQNNLTSACNPRANGSRALANQNARFSESML